MKTIYFILILYSIKFAIINAAGGQGEAGGSGSGRKRPSEQIAVSAGGNNSSGSEDNDDPTVAPIYRLGLFEKTADPNYNRCISCDKILSTPQGKTSQLTQHLRKMHGKSDYEKKFDNIRQKETRHFHSAIWDPDLFKKNLEENKAKCMTCKKDLSWDRKIGTSNLKTHLLRKHSELHNEYIEREKTRKEERKQQNSHKSQRLGSGLIGQQIAQNVPLSSNIPHQQHAQMTSLQQIDPNIAQTLAHEVASRSLSGQMVPSASQRAPIFQIGLFEQTDDPNKTKCRECNQNITSSGGNTRNVVIHLHHRHKDSDYEKSYNKIKIHGKGLTAPIYDPDMFTKNDDDENTFKCATCKKDFKGHVGNFELHLERNHSEVYNKYLERVNPTKKERLTERLSQQKARRLSSGSISQRMSQNVPASSNEPQHHGQMLSFQQNDPNIAQTLAHEVVSAFSGQMVPSATHKDPQTTQQLSISRTQQMLQQLHVSSNQPQHQEQQSQTLASGPTLRLSQQLITNQQQRQSRLSQQSLAQQMPHSISQQMPHSMNQQMPYSISQQMPHSMSQQMPHSISQQMQPSTISARATRISLLNNLATSGITRQQTTGQGSGSNIQQPLSQMDKGKGIMTEEPRTQSRPSERTFMGDAIRAERRTSQLGHQSISQQYYSQTATQAAQIGSGTMPHLSTLAQGRVASQSQQLSPFYGTGGNRLTPLQSLSRGTQEFSQSTSSFGTGRIQNAPSSPADFSVTAEDLAMLNAIIGGDNSASVPQPAIGLSTNRATVGRLSSLTTAYHQATQHQSSTNIDHQHENTGRDGELEMLTGMFSGQSSSVAGRQPATVRTTNRATGGRLSSLGTAYRQTTQLPSSGEQYGQSTYGHGAGGGTTRPSSFAQLAPLPSATGTQHYGQGTYGETGAGGTTRPSSFTGLAPLPPSLSMANTQQQSNPTMQQDTPSNIGNQTHYS